MSDEISVQQGFSEDQRASAAELYDAAFGAKLSIAIRNANARKRVLKRGFNSEFSFVALRGSEMIGIAGFKNAHGSLTGGISLRMLQEELGYWSAVRAVLVLSLFQRHQGAVQLLMDGIGVLPTMRGSGVGTKLLHRLIAYAQSEGYRSIRLDVIDTNPAARRLYERVGFVPVKSEHFTYLKWLLGFGAATQMEYRVNGEV